MIALMGAVTLIHLHHAGLLLAILSINTRPLCMTWRSPKSECHRVLERVRAVVPPIQKTAERVRTAVRKD